MFRRNLYKTWEAYLAWMVEYDLKLWLQQSLINGFSRYGLSWVKVANEHLITMIS